MGPICIFCSGSPRKGRKFVRDRKPPYLMGWIRCAPCKGTGHEIPVPTHAEALAAREAKAS